MPLLQRVCVPRPRHMDQKLSSLLAQASSDSTPPNHSEGQGCHFLFQRIGEVDGTPCAVQLVTSTAAFLCPKSAHSVAVPLTL